VIVHQMTALADMRSLRRFDRVFAATNELRTKGTDNIVQDAFVGLTRARQAGTMITDPKAYLTTLWSTTPKSAWSACSCSTSPQAWSRRSARW
jgi:hypothetical protein